MRPYLVVYDWACGQLMSLTAMPSEESAALQRAEVASAYADDASIEVSVVEAESADELRASLGRRTPLTLQQIRGARRLQD